MRCLPLATLLLLVPTSVPRAQAAVEVVHALHPEAASRARERLEAFLAAGHVPGVSAGVACAGGNLSLAAGVRQRGRSEALEPTDLLCAGSTGKTFVAAVVLQLVQEGKLSLAELAGERLGGEEWFERLPNASELTVENLLLHRSGLPRYEFQPEFVRDLVAAPDRVWRPADLLAYVLDHAPEVAADQGFAYSDTNYIVLGMLVESVTGATLYDEVQRRLLGPLQLDHVRPQDGRRIPGLVQGHAGAHDPLGFPELVIEDGLFFSNPQFEWAGGGFVSSGGDLARWALALYAGDVLKPEMRARMVQGKPAPELGRGVAYGLGAIQWETPHGPAWGHEGFFPGYMSCMCYWPRHGLAVAVQVDTSDFQDLPQPLGRLCEALLEAALPE